MEIIDLRGRPSVSLQRGKHDSKVRLINWAGHLTVALRGAATDRLEVEATPGSHDHSLELKIDDNDVPEFHPKELILSLGSEPHVVSVFSPKSPEDATWRIRGGKNVDMQSVRGGRTLELVNTSAIVTGNWNAGHELILGGNVAIGGTVSFKSTELLDDSVEISHDAGQVSFGLINTKELTQLHLTLRGSGGEYILTSPPPGLKILLDSATAAIRGDTEDLMIRGGGSIKLLEGKFLRPSFLSGSENGNADSRDLEVLPRVVVLGARGIVALTAGAGSKVYGKRDGSFVVSSISNVEDAELGELSIYDLDLEQTGHLESASRLSIWYPRWNWTARRLEGKNLAKPPTEASLAENVAKWLTLAGILKKRHASGSVQSYARYASYRWRRRLLRGDWRRPGERILLFLYWLVGYGERVVRPLATYLLVASLVAATSGEAWLDVVLSPLAVLRITAAAVAGESLWIALNRVVGIVCLGFSLLAMRRIVRAE